MSTALFRPFPLVVLAAAGAAAGVVGFTASAGIRDDMALATVIAIVAAAGTIGALARRPNNPRNILQATDPSIISEA